MDIVVAIGYNVLTIEYRIRRDHMNYYPQIVQVEIAMSILIGITALVVVFSNYTSLARSAASGALMFLFLQYVIAAISKQALSVLQTGHMDQIWKIPLVVFVAFFAFIEGQLKTRIIHVTNGKTDWHVYLGEIGRSTYPKVGDTFTLPNQDFPVIVIKAVTRNPAGKVRIPVITVKYLLAKN